ncbi:sulfotransferase [Flavisphingomonas formosensis]|uniref:sulfotransferase n=1 Tax=Flavisphingomonas formosensis TaxID=861534 RepID=UPI0012F9F16A|nr:sulfotransferase [Sphingomonas formosensis]
MTSRSAAIARRCARAPVIAHVGFHKTATSWFQRIFYPRVSTHRLIDRVAVRGAMLAGDAYHFDPAEARARLDIDAGPAILCDEDLSGVLHNGGLLTTFLASALADRLYAVIPEAAIVLFVREQTAMAAACYHQYVREGGTASISRYLFPDQHRHLAKVRPFKTPRFDFAQMDYAGLIQRYDSLFGRDRVHVFAYEAFARDPAGFLADYCERLGMEAEPASDGDYAVNASHRRGTLALARVLNLFTERSVADKRVLLHIPYWYGLRKRLLRGLDALPLMGARPEAEALLGPQTTAWIRGRFAPMNRWLADRMGLDLVDLGYALDAEPAARPARPAMLRAMRN